MFEDLKRNLAQEKKIVADMKSIIAGIYEDPGNKDFYISTLSNLAKQLDMVNNAIPELLREWFSTNSLTPSKKIVKKSDKKSNSPKKVVNMSYILPNENKKEMVTIRNEDKKEFLKKLKMNQDVLARIKKSGKKNKALVVKKVNPYIKFSNKFFRSFSDNLAFKFDSLGRDLKKANINILLSSYLSTAIMSCMLAFLFGIFIFSGLFFIGSFNPVFIVLPFGFSGLILFGFYFYPSSEASSVQKNISYELPFATIHMAAIAGSNIEPIKIFKIISSTEEYKNIGAEIKKVITQIEIYGYDLVTALKNVASRVPNKRLAELFSGLATNISTGGALKNYLEKKSENFLMDYRLERERYSDLAGTFMDVYISILIAAPLILMMMFIVMNVSGLGFTGISMNILLMGSILAVGVVNVIFLVVINMKQPKV